MGHKRQLTFLNFDQFYFYCSLFRKKNTFSVLHLISKFKIICPQLFETLCKSFLSLKKRSSLVLVLWAGIYFIHCFTFFSQGRKLVLCKYSGSLSERIVFHCVGVDSASHTASNYTIHNRGALQVRYTNASWYIESWKRWPEAFYKGDDHIQIHLDEFLLSLMSKVGRGTHHSLRIFKEKKMGRFMIRRDPQTSKCSSPLDSFFWRENTHVKDTFQLSHTLGIKQFISRRKFIQNQLMLCHINYNRTLLPHPNPNSKSNQSKMMRLIETNHAEF